MHQYTKIDEKMDEMSFTLYQYVPVSGVASKRQEDVLQTYWTSSACHVGHVGSNT